MILCFSYTFSVNVWSPRVKQNCFTNFLNLTLIVIFYRSILFISDILLELKLLKSDSSEFITHPPPFICFNTQYQKVEMVFGLKWLISTQQGTKGQNSWATWCEMCHPQVNRLQPPKLICLGLIKSSKGSIKMNSKGSNKREASGKPSIACFHFFLQ